MAKKKSKSAANEAPAVDFETALAEVEDVVQQLESGELGLSDSLVQYERGIEKIKICHEVLRKAETRIAVLTGVQEDGTAMVEPVNTGEEQETTPDLPRSRKTKSGGKGTRPPVNDMDDSGGLF